MPSNSIEESTIANTGDELANCHISCNGSRDEHNFVEDTELSDDDKPSRPPRCVGKCTIQLGDITQHNVMQLKKINQAVFPVSYNDKFYKEVIGAGELAKLAYFNDIIVGGVCCRIENKDGKKKLYIMTLGTLAAYRRFGVGSLMLEHVFSLCRKDTSIESVYLHVQTNNESALDFYKKFGFEVAGTAEKYYKRIEPDDAFILEKPMNQ